MIQTEEDARTKLSPDDVRQQFVDNRDDKSYRHAYADESLNLSIATQIKVLREQRELRQKDLADLAGMKQSMISRYENVNYSSWSINTLKKLAEAFDVVLDVRFRSFRDLASLTQGFSRESLQVPEFSKDPYFSEGYSAQQVQVTCSQPLKAVKATNVLFSYVRQPQGEAGSLRSVPDILYSQSGLIHPGSVDGNNFYVGESKLVVVGVSKNLANPEGVMYAKDQKATNPYYPPFVGGSTSDWDQRPSVQ